METELNNKVCSKCKEIKKLDLFENRPSAKDGKRGQCRSCVSEAQKKLRVCGIYKITSPSNKIYVGQSKNIRNRWSSYRTRDCPSQRILNSSLNKYGVENHKFDILEECLEEQLNKRERYWQELYDVVGKNGLNCHLIGEEQVYSKRGEGLRYKKRQRGAHVILPSVIDILDADSGVYLYTVPEASIHSGIPESHLSDMLKGKGFNKTNIIKGIDYEKGYLPNNLFTPKEGKTRVKIKEGFEVIDFLTGKFVGDTKKAAEIIGIKETTLRAYLNGCSNNKTNLIYKKDLDLGLTPNSLCNNTIQNIRSVNVITAEIYNSYKEAGESLGVSNKLVSDFLKGSVLKSVLPIISLDEYDKNKDYSSLIDSVFIKRNKKKVINVITGVIYDSIKDACNVVGYRHKCFMARKLKLGEFIGLKFVE